VHSLCVASTWVSVHIALCPAHLGWCMEMNVYVLRQGSLYDYEASEIERR
jgi:hypothetical protein